ncbi:MAG: hypothetical protein HQ558_02315 [Candidatus Omnitrophica bacterium]|nr:hypothetical protein [Candidatus Omnitrophota bacterium]
MRKILLILILLIVVATGTSYARRITWNKTEKPPVALEEALKIAKEELKKKEDANFYCIGAFLAKTFSEGDWKLHFSSTTGKEVWINVNSDKKARIAEHGFEH